MREDRPLPDAPAGWEQLDDPRHIDERDQDVSVEFSRRGYTILVKSKTFGGQPGYVLKFITPDGHSYAPGKNWSTENCWEVDEAQDLVDDFATTVDETLP